MPNSDDPLAQPRDIYAALALLTRLPVSDPGRQGAAAAWAWPLAGAVVGAIGALVAGIGVWMGLPAAIAAGLALAAMILATGGLHEDGLADTADGLWGGRDPERRLEIMRDSRLGSYGALALILSLGLRWAALTALIESGAAASALIVAAMLSRAAMAWAMAALPFARSDGLAASTGRPGQAPVSLGIAVALAGALLLLGPTAVSATLAAGIAAVAVAALGRAKIGGQTGDLLGAVQQAAEIAALAIVAARI